MRVVGRPLVWGYTCFDESGLVLVEEERAVRLGDELDRVCACTSVGQVRGLLPGLVEGGTPLGPDGAARSDDDGPFDWTMCAGMVLGRGRRCRPAEIERSLPGFCFGSCSTRRSSNARTTARTGPADK